VLETPERTYVPEQSIPRRTSVSPRRKLRRDFDDGYAEDFGDMPEDSGSSARRTRNQGVKLRWKGFAIPIPETLWGRIAAGTALVAGLGLCIASVLVVHGMLLRDDRFVVPDSSAVEIEGNRHMTQAQLLSVFGEDVGRNIFTLSLEDRQIQLQRLPWVQHATVMRLLPDHLRISIIERTPIAFVRQGGRIGLVDANGVLLDMAPVSGSAEHYSFPVVSGIHAEDPQSVRGARMKLYQQFTAALDSGGEKISEQLSEVDLSNPEDVKVLIPDKPADILVHFGDTNFLERYNKYKAHLAEWRAQYPKLASVDMRYDQEAVLQMQPGSDTPAAPPKSTDAAKTATTTSDVNPVAAMAKPVVPKPAVVKAPAAKPATQHLVAAKPPVRDNKEAPAKPTAKPAATASATAQPATAGNVAHWVTPDKTVGKSRKPAHSVEKKAAAKPHAAVAKAKPAAKPVKAKTPLKQGAQ
jgi:cell division protein FtsQ